MKRRYAGGERLPCAVLGILALGSSCAVPVQQMHASQQPQSKSETEVRPMTGVMRKLSPGTKFFLQDLQPGDSQVVSLLAQLESATAATDRRSAIEAVGGKVQSVAGDTVSIRLPADRIVDLAELDFVLYVETPTRMYLESGDAAADVDTE